MYIEKIKTVKIPRLISNVSMTSFCYDDCLATYSRYIGIIYEYMYFNSLSCRYIQHEGDDASIASCIEPESIKVDELDLLTGKINITHYSNNSYSVNQIKKLLEDKKNVLVNILGYYCPWDWRYKEVDMGGHAFFIIDINEEDEIYICMDPYYDIEYGELSFEEVEKGCLDFQCFEYKKYNTYLNDKKILLNKLKELLEKSNYEDINKIACNIQHNIELSKEIINYTPNEIMNVDTLNERVPLLSRLGEIADNRVRFAIALNFMADKYIELVEFKNLSKEILVMSECWKTTQMLLIKMILLNRFDTVDNCFERSMKNIVTDEEKIVRKLIDILSGKKCNTAVNKNDENYNNAIHFTSIDIDKYCNNNAIGKKNDLDCNLDGLGKFLNKDAIPKNGIINIRNISFKLNISDDKTKDNIQCFKQKIEINTDYYTKVAFLGCSDMGDCVSNFVVVYDDGTEENVRIMFKDWLPDCVIDEKHNAAFKTKMVVQQDNKDLYNEIDYYLYYYIGNIFISKKVKEILLPECENMHIFAISLGKYTGGKIE